MIQAGFLQVSVSFHVAASDNQQCDRNKIFLNTILSLIWPIFEVDLLCIDETWWYYEKVKNIVNGSLTYAIWVLSLE